MTTDDRNQHEQEDPRQQWRRLPPRIRPEDTDPMVDTDPVAEQPVLRSSTWASAGGRLTGF